MSTQSSEKEVNQIHGEIKFGLWFNKLHSRYYRRLELFLNFLQVLLGGSAFAGLLAADQRLAAFSGSILAIIAAINTVFPIAKKEALFSLGVNDYGELEDQIAKEPIDQIKTKLGALKRKYPDGLTSLHHGAYNIVCDLNKAPHLKYELTLMQRLIIGVAI